MAHQSLDALGAAVREYLGQWGYLTLEVGEDELIFDGESVYSHESSRDNLAFLMFRDGMRVLTLHHGIDAVEIEGLVDCLAHADDLSVMDHDLATALWERDFAHIDYRVADPFLAGETLGEGMIDALRETVLRRLEEGEVPKAVGESLNWGNLRAVELLEIEGERLQLTAEELRSGEKAVEGLSAVLQDFAEVLLEIAANDPASATDDVVAQSLTGVVAAYLDGENIDGVSFLVGRLRQMEAEEWFPRGFVVSVVGKAVSANHLKRLLQRAAAGPGDEAGRIGSLLLFMREWMFPPLLEILAETEDRTLRRSALAILAADDGVPWAHLEPLMRDPRWYVVRNALQLAASAGHADVIEHAQRLLGHADVRVRREAMRALEGFGGQAALQGFSRALSDPESSVRTLAARIIGREGGPPQEAKLLAHIEDRNFAPLPAEEIGAFFEAYATLAQERAVALLDKAWRKKLLSSRPLPFRVAAVLALGSIRGATARAALVQASESGELPIQRAAIRAMQTAQTAQTQQAAQTEAVPPSGDHP